MPTVRMNAMSSRAAFEWKPFDIVAESVAANDLSDKKLLFSCHAEHKKRRTAGSPAVFRALQLDVDTHANFHDRIVD